MCHLSQQQLASSHFHIELSCFFMFMREMSGCQCQGGVAGCRGSDETKALAEC